MAENVLQSFLIKITHQVDPAGQKKFQDAIKGGIDGLNSMRLAAVAAMVGVEEAIRRTTSAFSSLDYLSRSSQTSALAIEKLSAEFQGAGMSAQAAQQTIAQLSKDFLTSPGKMQLATQAIHRNFKDSADFMEGAVKAYGDAMARTHSATSGEVLSLVNQFNNIDPIIADQVRQLYLNRQRAQENAAFVENLYKSMGLAVGKTAEQMAQQFAENSAKMENSFWQIGKTFQVAFAEVITNPAISKAVQDIATAISNWFVSKETQDAIAGLLDSIKQFASNKQNLDDIAASFKAIGDAVVATVHGIKYMVDSVAAINKALEPVAKTLNFLANPFGGDPNAPAPGFAKSPLAKAGIPANAFTASEQSDINAFISGGGKIPSHQHGGIVSRLHEGEMVLPQPISQGLQAFFMAGGGGGASQRYVDSILGWLSGDSSYKPIVELGIETLTIMGYQTGQTGAPGGGAPGGGGGFGGGGGGAGGGGGGGGGGAGGGFGGGGGAVVANATKGNFRQVAMDYFTARGWTKEQAAGLTANLETESGGRTGAKGDSGLAYGIGQWHPDRQANFRSVFGHDIHSSTLQEQLAFVDWEMRNTESRAGAALRAQTSAAGAGGAVSRFYERPRDVAGNMRLRGNLASSILGGYTPGQAPTMVGDGGGAGGGSSPEGMQKAVDNALGMMGQSIHSPLLRQFVKAGAHLDPAAAAWCAAFVNSSIKAVGMQPGSSNIATKMSEWGHAVSLDQMMKGDVGVAMHNLASGMTGGHAVLMTGAKRFVHGREEVQTVGREGDYVNTRWRAASDLIFRRSNEMQHQMATAHLVTGGASTGTLVAGGGASLHRQELTINVHGNDNPSATAKAIQATQSRVTANHLRNLRTVVA